MADRKISADPLVDAITGDEIVPCVKDNGNYTLTPDQLVAFVQDNLPPIPPGHNLLSGAANPVDATGVNGDFYINTSTWYIFGPKAGGHWPAGVALSGGGGGSSPVDPVDLVGSFTLPEDASLGAPAGAFTGRTTGSVLTLQNNAGNRVSLSGTVISRGASVLDYETAPVVTGGRGYAFTVRETHSSFAAPGYHDTNFVLMVTDVAEGGSGLAPAYTNIFGTDTAATAIDGWSRFTLGAGRTRVWLDSINGSDAASGNGPGVNAKKSWAVAWPLYLAAMAANPGSQLMVAGGEGQGAADGTNPYTDDGTLSRWDAGNSYTGATGSTASKQYPSAIITYDSRDALNTALYGRLTRADGPWLTIAPTGTPCMNIFGDQTHGFANQGLRLRAADPNAESPFIQVLGRHDDVCWENFIKNRVAFARQSITVATYGLSVGFRYHRWTSYGSWAHTGGNEVLTGQNSATYEDYWTANAGWKIENDRLGSDQSLGFPTIFAHGIYHNPHDDTDGNNKFRRRGYIRSSADGDNLRGPIALSDVAVALREPMAFTLGGFSGTLDEHAAGVVHVRRDDLAISNDYMLYPGTPRGWLYQCGAAVSPSSVTNCLAILNTQPGNGGAIVCYNTKPTGATFNLGADFTNLVTVDWCLPINELQGVTGTETSTFTNCKTTTALTGTGNIAVTLSDFPNAKTELEIYTMMLAEIGVVALGHADLALEQLANYILWDPTIAGLWAQRFFDKVYPLYGLTPTFQAVTLPNMAAENPLKVYPADGSAGAVAALVATKTGTNSATCTLTPNRNNGTDYWVCTTSATKPTAAQVRAGQDHLGAAAPHGSLAIKSMLPKTVSQSGLTANTTYYFHHVLRTLLNNDSPVATSNSFTTDAAGAFPGTTGTLSAYFTFDDFSKLWKDTGRSTPATAIGDLIKAIDVKMGDVTLYITNSSGWLIQLNSAGKPVLISDGASSWSSPNAGALQSASGEVTVWAAVKWSGASVQGEILQNLNNAATTLSVGSGRVIARAYDAAGGTIGTDIDFSAGSPMATGTAHVVSGRTSVTNVEALHDNSSDGASEPYSAALMTTNGRIWAVGNGMPAGTELAALCIDLSNYSDANLALAQALGMGLIS